MPDEVTDLDYYRDLGEVLRDLVAARHELIVRVHEVPPEAYDRTPRGRWSAKQVLEHVLDSENAWAHAIAYLCGRESTPGEEPRLDLDTPGVAIRALECSRSLLQEQLRHVTTEQFYHRRPVAGGEHSVRDVLERVAAHDREHAEQVAGAAARRTR